MAGGAQLISDLLQGAFGSDNVDLDKLAAQAGYTHKTDADPTTGKPAYFNADTGQYLHDPSSLLPVKQPGFFQRAFAPNDANKANSINSSFATERPFATQADQTSSLIGANHTKRVQNYLNGDASITNTDPLTAFDATGRDPSVVGMNRAETGADEYSMGVPSAIAGEGLASAKAVAANQGNNLDYAKSLANLNGPAIAASNEVTGNKATIGSSLGRIKNQGALDILTGKNIALDTGNTDIGLENLPEKAAEAKYAQHLASTLAEAKSGVAPAMANTIANQARIGEIDSRYGQQPIGPVGMIAQPDGTVTYGRTGFQNPQLANAMAMTGGKGITGTDANGKKVSLPPMPIRSFRTNDEQPYNAPADQTNDTQQETTKPKLTPQQAKEQTSKSGIKGGIAEDTEGNLWYNGVIIKGPALDKQSEQQKEPDFRHLNDGIMKGLLK